VLGGTLLVALLLFIVIFIVMPNLLLAPVHRLLGDGVLYHTVEGVLRIVIFLAYLAGISLMADIKRVFMYHGAEHKTIAAWESGEELSPVTVDRYSTLHVRCGTNFLIMVMVLALLVYSIAGALVPPPAGIGWVGTVTYHVVLRIVLLPVIAGLAFELLRRFWGQGYATEAACAVLDWATSSGYERLWATVWDWNTASRRVLAKVGFTETDRKEADPAHGTTLFITRRLAR
jgi:uncharacterized protein YqhQ